jgi:hypothetical protein
MDQQQYNSYNTNPATSAQPTPAPRPNPVQVPTPGTPVYGSASGVPAKGKKIGPIMIVLVVVLILIIAAVYFFASSTGNSQPLPYESTPNVDATPSTQTSVSEQPVMGTSDDPQSLQADLQAATEGLNDVNF